MAPIKSLFLSLKNMHFEELFQQYKEPSIFGRHITLDDIEPLLRKYEKNLFVIGHSVLENPIYSLKIGEGNTRVLIWSQMHGNESTTTKALFDFINLLKGNLPIAETLRKNFTFYCLPMVNPDGAEIYSRENANSVDLNRDAQDLSQPESMALRNAFDSFKPNYCYNLHDQRTIYGAGQSGKPATVSFLAPAFNDERDVNTTRANAMQVIVAMNNILQPYIPDQVGRFDDSFNINCVGDTFQSLNIPTILFEAGHFSGDYQREVSRKLIFIALIGGLMHISENVIVSNEIVDYLNIPQNKVVFYDIVYKNVKINYDGNEIITNFAVQFEEDLEGGEVRFTGRFAAIGDLNNYFGHNEYDAKHTEYSDSTGNVPIIGEIADFQIGENIKVVNGKVV